jgi:hypothetical protein
MSGPDKFGVVIVVVVLMFVAFLGGALVAEDAYEFRVVSPYSKNRYGLRTKDGEPPPATYEYDEAAWDRYAVLDDGRLLLRRKK